MRERVDARVIIDELTLEGPLGRSGRQAEAFAKAVCDRLTEHLNALQGRRVKGILEGRLPAQAIHIPSLRARIAPGVEPAEVARGLAAQIEQRGRWS